MAQPGESISSNINLALPAQVPENFINLEVQASVRLMLNAMRNLLRGVEQYGGFTQKDETLWPDLTPSDTLLRHQLGRLYVMAGADLVFGNFINLYNAAGTLKVKKADSTVPLAAYGYCNDVNGVLTGSYTEVILGLGLLVINGVTPGAPIYLAGNGLAALAPDTTAGHINQYLGIGVATNLAYIDILQSGSVVITPSLGSLNGIRGAGAPTNGVTGVGVTGKGDFYQDISTPDLYINVNTLASPTWKLMAREG